MGYDPGAVGVACILLHRRAPERTLVALGSALASPEVERVYLLDNASADRLEGLAPSARVERLRSESNLGFAGGCNLASARAAAAGHDALLLLNSDARLEAGAAALLARRLLDPTVGIVAPKVVEPGDPPRLQSCGGLARPGLLVRLGEGELDRGQHDTPRDVDWAPGACLMARAVAWTRAGGFDERYFLYCEDVDLALRVRRLGLRVVTEPGARVEHAAAPGVTTLRLYYGTRNRLLLAREHRSALGSPWFELGSAGRSAGRAALELLRGRVDAAGAIVAGLSDFARGRLGRNHRWRNSREFD